MLFGMFPTSATAMTLIEEPLAGVFEIYSDTEFVVLDSFASLEKAEENDKFSTATPTDSPQLSQAISLSAEENGITFPVSIVRENTPPSRLRGVSTLHIEWASGYDYDFPLAPGFPIYGKWSIYWADSQLVYCVEPRNLVSTEGKLLSTTETWNGLSADQQSYVGYTLLYGNKDGTNIPEHIATQAIIWEIALGYRTLDDFFTRTSDYIYNGLISGTAVQTHYNELEKNIRNHSLLGSFMTDRAIEAQTYKLESNGSGYSVVLTDDSGMLSEMTFPNISGVNFSVSGNKLTITSDREIDPAELVECVKGSSSSSTSTMVFWVDAGGGNDQVKVAGEPDPVRGYFKISTDEASAPPGEGSKIGYLTINKYDGDTNLPLGGAVFRIVAGDFVNEAFVVPYGGGTIAIPIPEGRDSIDVTVTEKTPPAGGYTADPTPKTVTVVAGETGNISQVGFANYIKKAQLIVWKKDAISGQFLRGAVFRATHISSGVVKTAESGADGKAVFSDLTPGDWRIDEQTPPPYFLPTSRVETVHIPDGGQETIELTFENEPYSGLTIRKVGATDGRGLQGAVFGLYKGSEANPLDFLGEFQSDSNGRIVIENLESNQYYTVIERQPPVGHLLDENNSRTVFVTADALDNNLTLIFRNKEKPKILIEKVDEAGRPLPNATFRVKLRDSAEYIEVTTGADGTVLVENLLESWYQIFEYRSPDGFLKSDEVKNIELEAGKTSTIQFVNHRMPGLKIIKTDSVTRQPMEGVRFTIAYKNGKPLGEYKTDANGEIYIGSIEPGLLEITELPFDGYTADEPYKEVLVEKGLVTVEFQNTPLNPIIIKKIDSITGEPLAGAVFSVSRVNGEFVGEFTTGRNGFAVVTGVAPGFFIVKEVKSPTNYVLSSEAKVVELKYNKPAEVEFENTPMVGLQIIKRDQAGNPLSGVEFTVTELNGAMIGTFTSDRSGICYVPNLKEGFYIVKETRGLPTHKTDTTARNVQIKAGELNTIEFINYEYPTLALKKIDAETLTPIGGVRFKLMDRHQREIGIFTTHSETGMITLTGMDEGTYYLQEMENEGYKVDSAIREIKLEWGKTTNIEVKNVKLGSLIIRKIDAVSKKPIPGVTFLVYDSKGNILGEYITDNNGIVELPRTLEAQKLVIREVKAAPNYVLDEQPRTIEIKSGTSTEIVWENQPERGQIQIIKKSSSYNDITKDKAGAYLKDAVFEITNIRNEVVDRIRTDKNGLATSKPLPLGVYGIREVSSPDYYLTDGKMFYADIKIHNDLVKFAVGNAPVKLEASVEKRGNVEAMPGDSIRYDFSNIENKSNVSLEEFYWRDILPTEAVRLEKIWTGTWSERVHMELQIKTNLKTTYRTVKRNLLSTVNNEIDCSRSALGLATNEYVTEFRLVFGTVQPGFREKTAPQIQVNVLGSAGHLQTRPMLQGVT